MSNRKNLTTDRVWFFRKKILNEQDGWFDCPYCEIPTDYLSGEVDHINPVSMGGTNATANLIMVCGECNRKKGNRPLKSYLEMIGRSPEAVGDWLINEGKIIPENMKFCVER